MKNLQKIIKILIALLMIMNISSAKDLLLVDTSGSMNNFKTKESVVQIVDSYLGIREKVLGFNDTVYEVKETKDLKFNGGTNLAKAFNYIYSLDIDYVVLITDGIPSNKLKALRASKKLKEKGVKVCGVYVSKEDTTIPKILEKISDQLFVTSNLNQIFTLCSNSVKNRLLGKTAVKKSVNINKYDF